MVAAPSDKALERITEEEKILADTVQSLREQIHHADQKLKRESIKARELTSEMVAAYRDEDKQLIASDEAVAHAMSHKKAADIKQLEKLIRKPYFARFTLKEGVNGQTKDFTYKLGQAANPDCRIVDWRHGPIAKLYYEYKEGEEFCEEIQGRERSGLVELRNSVDIHAGNLKRLSCPLGTFELEDGEWKTTSGNLARNDGTSYTHLPPILSLITSDQYKLITEPLERALLIQGIAGSGKTVVALHRLAWLLHEDNSDVKANECLVLVKSPVMKSYIADSLPGLGIEGVETLTFREWAIKLLKRHLPQLVDDNGEVTVPMRDAVTQLTEANETQYGHIVVDEVQDFGPLQLELVRRSVKETSRVTLAGDTNQQLAESPTFSGWQALQESWGISEGEANFVTLQVSHRSTLPIMRMAARIRRVEPVNKGRNGRAPIWFRCYRETKGIEATITWLNRAAERYSSVLTAVLCKTPAEAKQVYSLLKPTFGSALHLFDGNGFPASEGIVVADIPRVKGLEFRNVLIWNPTSKSYPSSRQSQSLLYVACTRAEENLALVTWKQPSPCLPPFGSKLMRAVEYET